MNARVACLLALFLVVPCAAQDAANLRVNGARLNEHLAALSQFGRNPQGGVSRIAYTPADVQGREYAMKLMKDAGLDVHIDVAGNLVGTRPGTEPSLKPLLLGSHIDSVPEGGNYDGDVGSMSAIEVAQTLKERNIALRHSLRVYVWQNEEGVTIGSQAVGHGIDDKLLDMVSVSGKTMREGTRLLGGDPERIASARLQPGSIAGYFEYHIEQGGNLERDNIQIGIVEGIVGILHAEVTIEGFANHAGTTPMDQRHDALLSAARFIEEANTIVTSVPGRQVENIGWIKVSPGTAYNVIPGRVTLGLELRDLDEKKFVALFEQIKRGAERIGERNQTTFTFTEPVISHPALTDKRFQNLIDDTARSLGFTTKTLPSGAGHDAQELVSLGPIGMIFIPSIGGISHSPKEFSRPQDIENGANVLLHTVLRFDSAMN